MDFRHSSYSVGAAPPSNVDVQGGLSTVLDTLAEVLEWAYHAFILARVPSLPTAERVGVPMPSPVVFWGDG